jgi:hypothetical protein
MRQYVQTDLEVHRQVATTLAELILGGLLSSGSAEPETQARMPRTWPGISLFRAQIRARSETKEPADRSPAGPDLHLPGSGGGI